MYSLQFWRQKICIHQMARSFVCYTTNAQCQTQTHTHGTDNQSIYTLEWSELCIGKRENKSVWMRAVFKLVIRCLRDKRFSAHDISHRHQYREWVCECERKKVLRIRKGIPLAAPAILIPPLMTMMCTHEIKKNNRFSVYRIKSFCATSVCVCVCR